MKIKRIEHVGVVVKDVEASRALWEGCFGIKLDSVELVGLDGVLETWRLLAREAGINEVRHAIITTVQAENVLTDSGVVKMKMGRRDRIVIAERDTLLAFKSRWRVRNGEWRVVYEEMQRLSLPPSSK